jgi:hypothetical protein
MRELRDRFGEISYFIESFGENRLSIPIQFQHKCTRFAHASTSSVSTRYAIGAYRLRRRSMVESRDRFWDQDDEYGSIDDSVDLAKSQHRVESPTPRDAVQPHFEAAPKASGLTVRVKVVVA